MGICGDVWDFSSAKLDFEFEKLRMKLKSKIKGNSELGMEGCNIGHQIGLIEDYIARKYWETKV